jgi:pyruvate dehydrogenase E2 component (dihydrolipoamide acetyltransferase)
MAVEITIPRLGWNMEEGVFVGWRKKSGDVVEPNEPLFSLETDKTTQDVDSLDGGILWIPPDGPADGAVLPVGAIIGYLLQPGERPSSKPEPKVSSGSTTHGQAVESTGRHPKKTTRLSRGPTISPRALRRANQLGIDWKALRGSGHTGRIRDRDVLEAAKEANATNSIRKKIAERMRASLQATAPVTLTTTVDATNIVRWRNQFKAAGQSNVPSFTDILAKLTALALVNHPALNSQWTGNQIAVSPAIHIGIAVDTEAGLVVPVIRNIPGLNICQVAERSRDLITRARDGKLKAEDVQDGTFTITNLGAFGVETFTPIINYPQCAILGMGRIQPQATVVEGQIVVQLRLFLSLTFDHRIVDGGPAARFLQSLSRLIESPAAGLGPVEGMR